MSTNITGAGRPLKTRATVTVGAVLLIFLLLLCRLAHLQLAQADFYRRYANQQQILSRSLSACRGRIFDREGRLLAASVQRNSVFADPKAIDDPRASAAALASALDLDPERVETKLQKDAYFVWLRRQLSDQLALRVRTMDVPGVHMRAESKRMYPQGTLAAHIIGFTDVDGRGLAGVEKTMDALLRGLPGAETVLCDGGRHVFRSSLDRLSKQPSAGLDIHLTIDAYIQQIVEEELNTAAIRHAPQSAAALVLDVRDGAILGCASWPGFDPGAPTQSPTSHQRNIIVNSAYEFGSVMKPFCVALALEAGVVEPETEFNCQNGQWRIGRRLLHDAHPYGTLSVSDIICHSSNIGAAQIGLALGAERLHDGICSFGFGHPTGISLPGEVGGIVRPLPAWNDYSVVSVSFGQELAVTPLAVARAFAVFPNHGYLVQPRIIRRVSKPGGETIYEASEPMLARRVLSARTAAEVMKMLRLVVTEGTGKRAQLEEYPVAGKTGTAQLLRPDGRGYSDRRYLASFVGIAPADDPRLVALVCLKAPSKNGYYGGVAAAPAVREILRRTLHYLHVPPRQAPKIEGVST
ncbi:MAG: penicillin-binding protein 2 [Planctomycetes bacterium]|nr:penicillin-binding protein 2 [Planctomycetota bacterium]